MQKLKPTIALLALIATLTATIAAPNTNWTVTTITASTTLTGSQDVVISEATQTITITLPAAATVPGKKYTIANHGTAAVNLSTPVVVAAYETMSSISPNLGGNTFTIISANNQWRLIAQ
jgi:hypothetical protein